MWFIVLDCLSELRWWVSWEVYFVRYRLQHRGGDPTHWVVVGKYSLSQSSSVKGTGFVRVTDCSLTCGCKHHPKLWQSTCTLTLINISVASARMIHSNYMKPHNVHCIWWFFFFVIHRMWFFSHVCNIGHEDKFTPCAFMLNVVCDVNV